MTERCAQCGQAVPEFGGIICDAERMEVRHNGYAAPLTRQEMVIFSFLMNKRGRVASKDALFDQLYQLEDEDIEIKIIDVFICKLRKKLRPLKLEIGTVWAGGYFLEQPLPQAGTA